jgi:TRAP-type mannitol/chloroaromatic compound transport system permease large subunit
LALPPLGRGEGALALIAALVIALLLGAVAVGRLYAVEAAATGGVLLLAGGLASGHVDRALLRAVVGDAMVLTGLLMALLVGATTFSLVLRGLGTDALIAHALLALSAEPRAMLGAVLAGMVACAFVLDAFEMIFLVVPIVMPPVLSVVPDAAWVAALTLLVLQLGFLLPPLGYAVVMSRAALRTAPPLPALARALAPQLAAQMLLIVVLLAWPGLTRLGRDGPESAVAPAVSAEQAERMMDEQFGRNRGAADPADPAASEPKR